MTKSEFIEEMRGDIWALYEFCSNNGYDYFYEDLYSDDSRTDRINEEMYDRAGDMDWEEMRSWLNNLESSGNYDWWRTDDWGEWYGVDDDYIDNMIDELVKELETEEFFEEETIEAEEDEKTIEGKISDFFKVL